MAEPQFNGPQFNWMQAAPYIPGMLATNNSPEMGQLMSMFAGSIMGPMFGPNNFIPHLTPSMGVMDQYAMRHFQQQQMMSATAIGTANNENVAARLLALRTLGTENAATAQNREQALNLANMANHPIAKMVGSMLLGPETFEAMMHGTKGDVSQLHNATMRMGYYRRDPSGARRMDARSMEDFSRGVYAHLYEEGGDFDTMAQQAEFGTPDELAASRTRLKKAARVADDTEIITAAEFVGRVDATDSDMQKKINRIYKTHVQGNETDTVKQAEAIAKIAPAVKETGLLSAKEMLLPEVRREAEKMQVAEMHGLMAGQIGQLAEYMGHRGMLPQAIGSFSAADRVKLMGGQIDEDTLNRLALEETKRHLFASNEEYRNAGTARQTEMEQEQLDTQKTKIRETSAAIQEFNETGKGSIADLEKMGGFEAIASNVDSQRTASALKKYSGAVDAVREIFGDNGNPNAPMPALLAALDHLTQGANFQMDAKNVEATMRQMQMTAKEAGIGFEQMSAMSAQMGAMGQMLGLSPTAVMHGQVNAMAMIKTMRDTGAFATPRFGAMGQGEAQQFVAQKMIAGDASDNAKALAAAASIYQTGKESFAGTEFAAAMEAYLGGDGTYKSSTGEDVNLFERVGREGASAVTRMFMDAGGTQNELMVAFRSPLAQEFLQSGAGMQTQKYEAIRDINNFGMQSFIASGIESFKKTNAGSALAGQNAGNVSRVAGTAVTNMLVETAQMQTDEQIAFLKKEMPNELKTAFKTQLGLDDAAAQKMADDTFAAMVGTVDPAADADEQAAQRAEQNRRILQMRGQADAVISGLSQGQMNLVKFGQAYAGGRPEKAIEEARQNRQVALRRAEAGIGYKSHPLARASDHLMTVGVTGAKLSLPQLLGEVLNIVPNEELARRYVSGMEGGLTAANTRLSEISYTDSYLQTLTTGKKDDELLQLAARAGIDPATIQFKEDAATYDARGQKAANAILNSKNDDAIRQAYLAASGERTTGLSTEKMLEELGGSGAIAVKFRNQQAENAFYRSQAETSAALTDNNILGTYEKEFGIEARVAATDAGKTNEQLKSELLAGDFGVREGKRLADAGGIVNRQQLVNRLSESQKVIGTLRDDAIIRGGTKEEVDFLTHFNAGVFGAADADIRKDLVNKFTAAYGLSDTNTDDEVSKEQELDALLRNTKIDDKEAAKKLSDYVRTSMLAGGGEVDEQKIARAQESAETLRRGAAIDPAGTGITDVKQIGDITTPAATITANEVVINGTSVRQNDAPKNAPTPVTAPAAAQDAAVRQDAPLPPVTQPTETDARTKAATEQIEQTYGPEPDAPATSAVSAAAKLEQSLRELDAGLAAGNPEALRQLTGGKNVNRETLIAAGYGEELATKAVAPHTKTETINAAAAAQQTAQQSVQQNKSGANNGINGTVTGELSIVNLDKAVFTIMNSGGATTNTPGDMPVMQG